MKAAVCLSVTESTAPAELQRGHFNRAGPAFAQMKSQIINHIVICTWLKEMDLSEHKQVLTKKENVRTC